MALLNYAETLDLVKSIYKVTDPSSSDYIKLFFTKDKHIITHGVDYMSLFSPEIHGLVPASTGNPSDVLKASGEWSSISVLDLPIKDTLEEALDNSNSTILNTLQVNDFIKQSFTANDAMRFKGTISLDGNSYIVDPYPGYKGFPTKCNVGDTYKIASDGEYAESLCNFGDMLICIKDGIIGETVSTLNTKEYWTVVEYNLEYAKHEINGRYYWFASSDASSSFTIYAPNTLGSVELLLTGGETEPLWKHCSDITVGTANKTKYALSAGLGLNIDNENFDGSAETTINLVLATTNSIGGIIVDGLKQSNSDKENDEPTLSISDGHLYLSRLNIINALGYTPSDVATKWRPISIVGSEIESIGNKELQFSPTENIHVILDDSDPNIAKISYTLGWYNINNKAYEYDEASL